MAPLLLEVLQWGDLRRAPKPGPGQSPDVLLQRQVRASVNRQNEAGTRLRVAAKGLRKGQLVAWCDEAGLRPDAMHRARLGRLGLGALASGQWRLLMGYERF